MEHPDDPVTAAHKRFAKEFDKTAAKFQRNLSEYVGCIDKKRCAQLEANLLEEVKDLHASANELDKRGMHKQEITVEHDLKKYIETKSDEILVKLQHDLTTLRDFLMSD